MTMPSLVANRVEFADLSAVQRRFDHAVGSMIGLEETRQTGLQDGPISASFALKAWPTNWPPESSARLT
jgi:hypothetical protein